MGSLIRTTMPGEKLSFSRRASADTPLPLRIPKRERRIAQLTNLPWSQRIKRKINILKFQMKILKNQHSGRQAKEAWHALHVRIASAMSNNLAQRQSQNPVTGHNKDSSQLPLARETTELDTCSQASLRVGSTPSPAKSPRTSINVRNRFSLLATPVTPEVTLQDLLLRLSQVPARRSEL